MSTADAPDDEHWVFIFAHDFADEDLIWTRHVEKGVATISSDAEIAKEVTLIASLSEAVQVKETLTRLGSATIKQAVDSRNIVEDSRVDERSTVRVLPPVTKGEDILRQGRYVVEDYAINYLNPAYYEVELALARKDDITVGGFGFDFGHNFGLQGNPRDHVTRPPE